MVHGCMAHNLYGVWGVAHNLYGVWGMAHNLSPIDIFVFTAARHGSMDYGLCNHRPTAHSPTAAWADEQLGS